MMGDYRDNRAVIQVHEKGYFDNPTEAASAIFGMTEKIFILESALAERDAKIEKLENDIQVMVEKAASKHLPAYREMGEKLAARERRIEELEAENFALAAGACCVEGGLVGDERGHAVCTLAERLKQAGYAKHNDPLPVMTCGSGTKGCHAMNDGECHWSGCPQLRDNEPERSGRHCQLDVPLSDEDCYGV